MTRAVCRLVRIDWHVDIVCAIAARKFLQQTNAAQLMQTE